MLGSFQVVAVYANVCVFCVTKFMLGSFQVVAVYANVCVPLMNSSGGSSTHYLLHIPLYTLQPQSKEDDESRLFYKRTLLWQIMCVYMMSCVLRVCVGTYIGEGILLHMYIHMRKQPHFPIMLLYVGTGEQEYKEKTERKE